MCRLFGLTAGAARVTATFWLLDAPDSLAIQSRRNADGAGLGYFGPDGEVVTRLTRAASISCPTAAGGTSTQTW